MQRNSRGFTLIELLIVMNIVAILMGLAVVYYAEFGNEARYSEIYGVFPRIIRSQKVYATEHGQYYTALDHGEFLARGVDLSAARYFTYSTFPNEFGAFSIRADTTDWAPGGWVLFAMNGTPTWSSDGAIIKDDWLPR